MALQIDTVSHACNLITREIRDYQKNLTVHYIVHHEGQRTEALGMAAQNILSHPASETAMHILQKPGRSEQSVLLGTAVARKNLFFGLASHDTILSLCTMNIDEFNTVKEAQRHAYHLAWHAIDAANYHADPHNRTGKSTEVIIRKRNALELSSANMQADVFSAAMSWLHRDKEATRRLALKRGMDAVTTKSMHNPEFYPFAIVLEATEFALKQLEQRQVSKKKIVPEALKIAERVAKSFDDINLKCWMAFAEPAQDMVWRGFSPEEILSAAINTSKNTYVRATGFMISELSATDPASVLDIRENYSPFADSAFNEQLHKRMVDQIYQDIIAQGVKHNSALPFLHMANRQNEALTEGNVMGWCASALHAAGAAYENAQRKGLEPELHAHEEFTVHKDDAKWDELSKLGKKIIKNHRQGYVTTMSDIDEIAKDIGSMKALRHSVGMTMTDPQYKQKLEAAGELDVIPKAEMPAPEAAPRIEPQAAPQAAAVPGLGGRKTVIRQVAAEEKQNEDNQQ